MIVLKTARLYFRGDTLLVNLAQEFNKLDVRLASPYLDEMAESTDILVC